MNIEPLFTYISNQVPLASETPKALVFSSVLAVLHF